MCGGYKLRQTSEERDTTKPRHSLLPKIEQTPTPSRLHSPSISTITTQRVVAKYALTPPQIFCVEASVKLCRFLEQPRWIANSLQICMQYPFLRHAFSSIRLLSKAPSSYDPFDPSLPLLTTIEPQFVGDSRPLATLHCEYFTKSAYEALPGGYNDPTRLKFSAFILLLKTCLDTLKFESGSAFKHIRTCLMLLAQLVQTHASSSSLPIPLLSDTPFLDIALDHIALNEMMGMFGQLHAEIGALDGYVAMYKDTPAAVSSPFHELVGISQQNSYMEESTEFPVYSWDNTWGIESYDHGAMDNPWFT